MKIKAMQSARTKEQRAFKGYIARIGITEAQAIRIANRASRLAALDEAITMAELRRENRSHSE